MFTLGRDIDFHYPTNKLIIILSAMVVGIGWFVNGSFMSGLSLGGSTFITWALARELDPKHEYSAFLAVTFSLLNIFYFESVQIMVIFWIILMMRVITGICGKNLTFFDIFSTLALTLYLSFSNHNIVYLLLFAVAMFIVVNYHLHKDWALLAGGVALATLMIDFLTIKKFSLHIKDISYLQSAFTIAVLLGSLGLWFLLSKNKVKDDLGKSVKKELIFLGQVFFTLSVLLLYFIGAASINNLIIYLSVIVGIGLYWLGLKLFVKKV